MRAGMLRGMKGDWLKMASEQRGGTVCYFMMGPPITAEGTFRYLLRLCP
ncbi:hypothetical protein OCV99_13830 [Dorea acetigenes]|uniref:Uncharacterized protein n=1 Tax=Dorea acetigenes TaxID=2981787 RepID=A0ABT2RQB3_9FIRM|nr:hypothetical protein [Dorea acetigenes]MCB6416315.1 hypothetical protein [Faecalimonas umbilicata]MCU6687597.1 hypothetical protein [Dorea acetigenes]